MQGLLAITTLGVLHYAIDNTDIPRLSITVSSLAVPGAVLEGGPGACPPPPGKFEMFSGAISAIFGIFSKVH